MENLELSIIIPAFNAEKYISDTIHALLNQDLSNYEVIIIDDGSKDNTGNICKEFAHRYPQVHYICKENEGQGIARNVGIEYAHGKYIAFSDSDDLPRPHSYAKIIQQMELEGSDVGVCMCRTFDTLDQIPEYNEIPLIKNWEKMPAKEVLNNICNERRHFGVSACNKIYRTEIIKNYGIRFRSERVVISEDFLFNFDYFQKCTTAIVSDMVVYFYRMRESSFSHSFRDDYIMRLQNLINIMGAYDLSKIERQAVCFKLYTFLKSSLIQEVKFQPLKLACTNIKSICKLEITQNILNGLNPKNLDRKNRLLYLLMQKKSSIGIYILYRMKG